MHKRHFWVIIILLLLIAASATALLIQRHTSNGYTPVDANQLQQTKPMAALACVKGLPIDLKIGQKIMVAAYIGQLATEIPTLTAAKVDGIIVMGQISKSAIADYTSSASIVPTVAVDQEGGTVQRYIEEGRFPGATTVAATLTPEQAYAQYLQDAEYLKTVGITTNFAPVVDVASAVPNPLPGRMYSSDPTTVIRYATESIKASQAAGITPVIKHFPGLGSSSGNTDFESAVTDSYDTLKDRDLIPYQRLSGLAPDVMVANAIVPGLTDGQPAIWSSPAVALLRSYGYQQAVVYSDSLTAKAIPGSLEDAAIKTWAAGVDVALIVQTSDQTLDLQQYIEQIITRATGAIASGELTEDSLDQSVLRILNRKGVDPCNIVQQPAIN
ncbi:MAG: glycoside hydrolase family 3 N-terminal domain-containing protein [Candidatus Saccharimonas sp.]